MYGRLFDAFMRLVINRDSCNVQRHEMWMAVTLGKSEGFMTIDTAADMSAYNLEVLCLLYSFPSPVETK